ncbi:hypothetical protein [Tateyamaria omphalii]|uniref:YdhG-like domain-containing protein n=1 Tax=Tateyamaria omphalii TaxID=299262 RepID=A0A1P8MUJ3_9RHOB|nr:hypothetical protein [Tateyamaria omphalii]APX11725.1 hypothetical protein BWR18_08535 [Tateyamaria omphalii]
MDMLPSDILTRVESWPQSAQSHFLRTRTLVHDVATSEDVGPLDESLKWGQPSWRPKRARTGSTLRLDWSPATPDRLLAFVDCKTDLAAQMDHRFPGQFHNDGRRALGFDTTHPLDKDAVWQLARLTLTYHRSKRGR